MCVCVCAELCKPEDSKSEVSQDESCSDADEHLEEAQHSDGDHDTDHDGDDATLDECDHNMVSVCVCVCVCEY